MRHSLSGSEIASLVESLRRLRATLLPAAQPQPLDASSVRAALLQIEALLDSLSEQPVARPIVMTSRVKGESRNQSYSLDELMRLNAERPEGVWSLCERIYTDGGYHTSDIEHGVYVLFSCSDRAALIAQMDEWADLHPDEMTEWDKQWPSQY